MKTARVLLVASLCGAAVFLSSCGKKEGGATGDASTANSSNSAATTGSAGSPGGAAAGAPTPASGRVIEITGNDSMKFSLTEIRAKPGESLSVTLTNIGTMPKFSMGHNWVLLKSPSMVDKFVAEAPQAATTDYIPASGKDAMLAHTRLLGPKETDTVTFQAPKEPGRYPFLCSFPGHYQVGMKGELIVE
jgi:azurin